MGEYATRKSDGVSIKIGTCESMYYLRLEDKDQVIPDEGSGFGWFYRLPFPDEDKILPGEYDEYKRGLRLYNDQSQDFSPDDLIDSPGSLQLRHESGLMVSLPCFHGLKLPEISSEKYDTPYSKDREARTFWNGKSWCFELVHLKETEDGVLPVIQCRHCQNMWRMEWDEVLPYVHGEMFNRLALYAGRVDHITR